MCKDTAKFPYLHLVILHHLWGLHHMFISFSTFFPYKYIYHLISIVITQARKNSHSKTNILGGKPAVVSWYPVLIHSLMLLMVGPGGCVLDCVRSLPLPQVGVFWIVWGAYLDQVVCLGLCEEPTLTTGGCVLDCVRSLPWPSCPPPVWQSVRVGPGLAWRSHLQLLRGGSPAETPIQEENTKRYWWWTKYTQTHRTS